MKIGERFKEKEFELKVLSKKTNIQRLKDYLIITVAAFIYAVAVSLFLDPNSLAPGGVTGISIILSKLTSIGTGTWFFLINIPIMLLGVWKFGIRFILSTFYCTVLTSTFTNLLSSVGAATNDLFLAALAGAVLQAIAIGIVFKAGATTGGSDIVVKVLRTRFPYLKTGSLFLITDTIVVTTSALIFRDIDIALYAGMVVFITSVVLDMVLYGRDGAKILYIISNKPDLITNRLLEELDVGATYIKGQGAYSGDDKKVIMCVIKKHLSPKAEEIIKEEDPFAFIIVSSATEIFGEGYKNIFSEKI